MKNILKKGLCAIFTCIAVGVIWLVSMQENNISTVKAETNDSSIVALKSYVTDMNIKGYIGTNIKNNIKYWQIGAYEDNQGIVRQIANAQSGVISLGNVLGTDYYGVSSYYDISIHERNNQNSLGWTLVQIMVLLELNQLLQQITQVLISYYLIMQMNLK